MKTVDIVGKNYFGHWEHTRPACRGIVIRGDEILLSYAVRDDQWMIPGGGLEDEDEKSCCIREVAEETGMIVVPSEPFLEIDEYYEDCKYISRYFICQVTGTTEPHLTDREREVDMEPRWMPIDDILEIFSRHDSYAETDEMTRGMYQREHTALKEYIAMFR